MRFRPTTTVRRAVASAVLVAGVLTGSSIAAGSPASAASPLCADGHVCLNALSKIDGHEYKVYDWYYYGTYNVSNQYGYKYLYNEQTGSAVLRLYSGYNGTGNVLFTFTRRPNNISNLWYINFTPVNSVKLSPS